MKKFALLLSILSITAIASAADDFDLFVTDYMEDPTPEQKPFIQKPTILTNAAEVIVKTKDGKTITQQAPERVVILRSAEGDVRQVKMFASPGEYEPFSFTLSPKDNLEQVMITASDLSGPGTIAGSNVVIASVEPFHGGSKDILMPIGKPWDMAAAAAERFWYTVKVPADAKAGIYKGTATVNVKGKPAGAINVELEVLPITLKDVPYSIGFNYSKPATAAALEAELKDMREHGMTTVAPLYKWELPIHNNSTKELGDLIESFKKAGFPGTFFFATPMGLTGGELAGYGDVGSRRFQQKLLSVLRLVNEEIKKHDIKYIMSVGDENTNKGLPGVKYAGQIAKFLGEEFPELPTTSDMNGYMEVMAMAPYLNVATFNDGWAGADGHNKTKHLINKAFITEVQEKTGAIPWFVNAQRGRFPFGFFFWKMAKYGVQGKIEWYYFYDISTRGWSSVNTQIDKETGKVSVYPTLDYERCREGIDDLKYLCCLEDLIAQAKKANKTGPELKKAEDYVKSLSDLIADDWAAYGGGSTFDGFAIVDPDKAASVGSLNAIRYEIAMRIVELQKAMAK